MAAATGIVALSFAKRAEEPNPVNIKLAEITDSFNRKEQFVAPTVVVAQWEIALALQTPPDLVVGQEGATNLDRNGKPYLDSQDVLNKAFALFEERDVTDVIVVANPFLHLQAVRKLVEQAGFNVVMEYKVPWVGFDNNRLNLQWWCKGPLRFMIYLGIQVIGKMTGHNFHGIGEKPHPH